jgi:DMSO reductase family type II enzyme chaperone
MDPTGLPADSCMAREEVALWGFLHDLFRPPSAEQWNWLREDPARAAWTILAGMLDREVMPELPVPDSLSTFEQDYLAAFEVGLPHPPCPLIESHWNHTESVPKVLHENTLFYQHFGLKMSASTLETADHLCFQLDFLRHLARLWAEALEQEQPDKAAQIVQARADYLERHLGWIPEAAFAYREQRANGWPVEWMTLLAGCVEPIVAALPNVGCLAGSDRNSLS